METDEPMFTACGKLYSAGLSVEDSDTDKEKNSTYNNNDRKAVSLSSEKQRLNGRLDEQKHNCTNFSDTKGFHSVILDPNKCNGCTHCVQDCPTEAIRIRNGIGYFFYFLKKSICAHFYRLLSIIFFICKRMCLFINVSVFFHY